MNNVPSNIYPISNPVDVFSTEYNTDYLVGTRIIVYLPVLFIF